MREEIKRKLYHKEDFYKGMAAIVAHSSWHTLKQSVAVEIALKATNGACDPGEINNAFAELYDEWQARSKF
ncbi:MAG: hypothetical protein N4A61_04560 [Pelagimonas sp.]|jgi:hypothetical protein|nr:hypothetical protein [Pelagimonas sp.]